MAKRKQEINPKVADLQKNTESGTDQFLTTDQGLRINDDQNSVKAGERGPSLLEDFILREKITHFDHERIPERVVHARGIVGGDDQSGNIASKFIKAIAQHRHWSREDKLQPQSED